MNKLNGVSDLQKMAEEIEDYLPEQISVMIANYKRIKVKYSRESQTILTQAAIPRLNLTTNTLHPATLDIFKNRTRRTGRAGRAGGIGRKKKCFETLLAILD